VNIINIEQPFLCVEEESWKVRVGILGGNLISLLSSPCPGLLVQSRITLILTVLNILAAMVNLLVNKERIASNNLRCPLIFPIIPMVESRK
jgi:hypothetical protein